jgi:hypothetical protein
MEDLSMKRAGIFFILMAAFIVQSCGGLRYSQVSPEAKDFHPQRIGILPADPGSYEEARDVIDEIMAGDLVRRGWFSDVVAGETMKRLIASNKELRGAVSEYINKVATVNYSDPELAKKIGETARVDAFLIAYVDFWNYTREAEEKVAKVGLALKLVNVPGGQVVWKAGHHEIEDYLFMRPKLTDVAERLARKMFNEMPH